MFDRKIKIEYHLWTIQNKEKVIEENLRLADATVGLLWLPLKSWGLQQKGDENNSKNSERTKNATKTEKDKNKSWEKWEQQQKDTWDK